MSHAFHHPVRARFAALLACLLLAAPGLASADQESPAPGATPCQESVPELYKRVSLSVVSVEAVSINPRDVGDRVNRVAGSGVIVDPSGLIVTNSHVVLGRRAISVTLDDGTMLPASLVGADPVFDVALIRIPPPATGTLPVARLGDSDHVVVGEEVLTIGNPFALEQTLTRGIVSAINRILPNTPLSLMEPLIQTDASINPGSSGGALINHCGEVIGITTAILPEAQNIGFVIPINLVKEVMPLLVASGRVIRPWLGVQGQLVAPVLKELLRIPLEDGFLVEVVEPGSPAEQQGIAGGKLDMTLGGQSILLGGDIITVMNGVAVDAPEKLEQVLRALKVGATVRMTVFRDRKLRQVDVAVVERPLLPGDILVHQSVAPLAAAGTPGSAGPSRRFRVAF